MIYCKRLFNTHTHIHTHREKKRKKQKQKQKQKKKANKLKIKIYDFLPQWVITLKGDSKIMDKNDLF